MKFTWLIALSTEISKIYFFFQLGPNFEGGTARKFRGTGNNRHIYCYANRGVVNFEREYCPLPPGINILVFTYMPDKIIGKKNEKTQFSGKILTFLYGPVLPKYKDILKIFTNDQTSYAMDYSVTTKQMSKIHDFSGRMFCHTQLNAST